ncbi:uncharacterized protein A4U43_C09F10580 [Asparagus officinalis]|uniref:Glycoside hydrolase family 5 domain-containing protein n=1 Tax=Asparagus officinalis TaxID=4686 RepID=A0A5P1E8F3_ASPOF|nr:uncharacterized protein LOC109824735 [Asparagus officinalis]ONK58283.1 uncharacterized protein A4U43_C09F10580 [Asparagus officinalis]
MKPSFFHSSLSLLFSILFQTLIPQPASALPLSTSGRWIVDEITGQRVKLACVNWASHLETMVAEGLDKRPLDEISKTIGSMRFNCVRLTWPTYLVADSSVEPSGSITVHESLRRLGLNASIIGIYTYNNWILDQTLIQAFKAVVSNLGSNHIMVILDNHITKPGWCCNYHDGDGFFGDEFFNPKDWISGLTKMAEMFKEDYNVVGMSLRNELRGPRQNVPDWYKYMQMGAEAVHKANPNVLVILSGLDFDTDLSFLSNKKIELSFTTKEVYEMHWYSFTNGDTWNLNANDACSSVISSVMSRAGFLLSHGWPLFMSEWGIDQRGENNNDNRYLGCFLATAAALDVDWGLWALQGSYYLREGIVDAEEFYGVFSLNWERKRNQTFLDRIASLRSPFQGPGLNHALHTILYHPTSGMCVNPTESSELSLGSCDSAKGWRYTKEKLIQLQGTNLFARDFGPGYNVTLSDYSPDTTMKWDLISATRMHISSMNETDLCLDVGRDGYTLMTYQCCLGEADQDCDPEGQWFKMVSSNRPVLQYVLY